MNDTIFRDALLAAEPPSPELEQRFRERLQALTHRRLSTGERVGLGGGIAGAAGVAAWFVQMLRVPPPGHHPVGPVALWTGLALCVGWALYSVSLLRRGTEDLRRDGSTGARLMLLSTIVGVVLLYWAAVATPDPARGDHKLLVAVLVWTMAGLPGYLAFVLREQNLRTRIDLLRLELAIARRDGARP